MIHKPVLWLRIRWIILTYRWSRWQIRCGVRQIYRAEHGLLPWAPIQDGDTLKDVLDDLGKILKAEREAEHDHI